MSPTDFLAVDQHHYGVGAFVFERGTIERHWHGQYSKAIQSSFYRNLDTRAIDHVATGGVLGA